MIRVRAVAISPHTYALLLDEAAEVFCELDEEG